MAAVLVVLFGISGDIAICRAEHSDNDVPGAEVLTRGPVHEAFAGMVTFNPEPGVVVTKAPPAVIEEMPPEERPEGDNVTWIPGYWGWDDERSDFLWVSGTWRALPPGRAWMAGYWGQSPQGFQWTCGYWADATARETTYLPAPPATMEEGPNIAAPSPDYGWTPGCWVWYQGRYAWRPGYWAQGRVDWNWCPAHYVWSPRGYIFVGGFWDYPVERRGILFAPVYFESGVYSRHGYSYSPTIVISLGAFTDHLFLRPSYQHYYFGDYYAPSYSQGGFYASFSFQSGRYGYDPIYSHQRWEHRRDREWEHRVETSYQYRRDHETARPPRTWAAQTTINQTTINQTTVNQTTVNQTTINQGTPESQQTRVVMATPFAQLVKRTDSPMRFQPVATEERQKLTQRGQEVQQSREQRRTLEAKAVDTAAPNPGRIIEPVKVQLPRSPIVAKPAQQLGLNQAPPEVPQAPKPDLKVQPKSETSGRQPNVDRSNLQREPRRLNPEQQPTVGQNKALPRETKAQHESQQRANDAAAQANEAAQQRNANALEQKAQQESERRTKESEALAVKQSQQNARETQRAAQLESQRQAKEAGLKAQQESQQRAKDTAAQAQRESQRNASALEKKAQAETKHRVRDAVVKPPEDSQTKTNHQGKRNL